MATRDDLLDDDDDDDEAPRAAQNVRTSTPKTNQFCMRAHARSTYAGRMQQACGAESRITHPDHF